jgi:hypothetical protein
MIHSTLSYLGLKKNVNTFFFFPESEECFQKFQGGLNVAEDVSGNWRVEFICHNKDFCLKQIRKFV